MAGLVTTMFFGGWQVPYLSKAGIELPGMAPLALPALAYSGRLCGRMLAIPALRGPMGPAYAALDWLML